MENKYNTRLTKYTRSFILWLTILINSCSEKQPSIQLLHYKELPFPSASAIEYYQNKLYVFGDDATSLLVLSINYEVIDSILFWTPHNGRISKEEKHDIESAMIREEQGEPFLFGVGSMSAEKRWGVLKYNLNTDSIFTTTFFDFGKTFPGIDAVNIEGSCAVNNTIILSNRANLSNPVNHLLFWTGDDSIVTKKIILPSTKIIGGISGLYYLKEKDLLLFTASEEETPNAIADGAIGESYLGWIEKFSKKMNDAELRPSRFLKLSDADKIFAGQKIESVCLEKIDGDEMLLHLVADNDNGRSGVFKVRVGL